MKLLIVEDQKMPLVVLEEAVKQVMLEYFPGFRKEDCDVAKWYIQAEEMIGKTRYDIVLLDHRMPWQQPPYLESEDVHGFCDSLKNLGYGLIPLIREHSPEAKIIGTSSLTQEERGNFETPDYALNKFNAEQDLKRIVEEICRQD